MQQIVQRIPDRQTTSSVREVVHDLIERASEQGLPTKKYKKI